MGSFPEATHKYAIAMVEAARTMPAKKAEKLDHIKQLRFDVQLKALRKRINKRITYKLTFYSHFCSVCLLSTGQKKE